MKANADSTLTRNNLRRRILFQTFESI